MGGDLLLPISVCFYFPHTAEMMNKMWLLARGGRFTGVRPAGPGCARKREGRVTRNKVHLKRQRAGPGGTHPSSPRLDQHGTVAVPNRKLITQLRAVQHALAQGVLDPTKVMVVPHENRTDTWFLRFTNLESDEWRGGEIVAWIVFDYVPDRGKGTSKPLATFPDKPPLFGVLTPTGVFTPQTGAKWVCLPGLAQGFGNEELVWQTVYSGQLPGSHPRYNFDLVAGGHAVRVTSANPKNVHFKGGSALPVLDGSMVNYVRVLLDQFDSPGGWYKLATIGADEHVDGMHDRSVLAANVANGTTGAMLRDAARWNVEHLGPLMEKFREADASLQGAAPAPPPATPATSPATARRYGATAGGRRRRRRRRRLATRQWQ